MSGFSVEDLWTRIQRWDRQKPEDSSALAALNVAAPLVEDDHRPLAPRPKVKLVLHGDQDYVSNNLYNPRFSASVDKYGQCWESYNKWLQCGFQHKDYFAAPCTGFRVTAGLVCPLKLVDDWTNRINENPEIQHHYWWGFRTWEQVPLLSANAEDLEEEDEDEDEDEDEE